MDAEIRAPSRKPNCKHCGTSKTWVDRKARPNWVCVPCVNRLARLHNPAYAGVRAATRSRKPAAVTAIASARVRARVKGVPCTITERDIGEPVTCACCAVPIQKDGKNYKSPTSPTIDRIVPVLGYVPGNVAWLCWRCNRIKNDGTAVEHRQIACYIERYVK